jgi:hypothetical protein
MIRHLTLVRTDISEERIGTIIRAAKIGGLGTTLTVTSNLYRVLRMIIIANVPSSSILVTLMMEAIRSFGTSVFTRSTRRTIQEDGILQLKYICGLKSLSVTISA